MLYEYVEDAGVAAAGRLAGVLIVAPLQGHVLALLTGEGEALLVSDVVTLSAGLALPLGDVVTLLLGHLAALLLGRLLALLGRHVATLLGEVNLKDDTLRNIIQRTENNINVTLFQGQTYLLGNALGDDLAHLPVLSVALLVVALDALLADLVLENK